MSNSSWQRKRQKREASLLKKVTTIPFPGSVDGSLRSEINLYIRSHDYKQLALATKRNYYRALIRLGSVDPVFSGNVSSADIHKILVDLTPGMAAQFIATGSVFYNWLGGSNPFEKIKKPKCGEWEAWTIDDVKLACANAAGAHMLLFIAAFTGLRLSDIRNLQSLPRETDAQDVLLKGLMLRYKQQKTKEEMLVPIPAAMFEYYATLVGFPALEVTERMLGEVTRAPMSTLLYGDPEYDARYLSRKVGKPFHGLRKTCSWLLAEGECSVHEIAAVTGHRTMTMLTKYTKMAEKRKLAQSALDKMVRRLNDERPTGLS